MCIAPVEGFQVGLTSQSTGSVSVTMSDCKPMWPVLETSTHARISPGFVLLMTPLAWTTVKLGLELLSKASGLKLPSVKKFETAIAASDPYWAPILVCVTPELLPLANWSFWIDIRLIGFGLLLITWKVTVKSRPLPLANLVSAYEESATPTPSKGAQLLVRQHPDPLPLTQLRSWKEIPPVVLARKMFPAVDMLTGLITLGSETSWISQPLNWSMPETLT